MSSVPPLLPSLTENNSEKTKTANSMVLFPSFIFIFLNFHGVLCLPLLFLPLCSEGYGLPRLLVLSSGCFHSTLSRVLKSEAGSKQYEIISLSISLLVNAGHVIVLFVSVYTSHWEFFLTVYFLFVLPTKGHSPSYN